MATNYVKSWFARGDDDLVLVKLILEKGVGSPNLACFHAQQAAEKYLKGFLAHQDLHVRKIHDLEILLEDCKNIDSSFAQLQDNARFLSQFYIESRYPDDYVEFPREDAEKAFEAAICIKEFILKKIESARARDGFGAVGIIAVVAVLIVLAGGGYLTDKDGGMIQSVFAYQCEQPRPLAEEIDQSSAIFIGKVADIEFGHEAGTFVNFEVKRTYKGNVEKAAQVKVDRIGGGGYGFCGVHLKIGESYLVYASGKPLSTNICTRGIDSCNRTESLKNASEDLAFLETSYPLVEIKEPADVQPPEEPRAESRTGLLSIETFLIGFIMFIVGIFIGRRFALRK